MQAVNVETMMDTTGFISVIKATIKSIALILSAQFGSLCTRFFRYSSSHYNKFTNGKFEVFLNSTSLSQIIAIMWYFIFRMSCLPKNLYDWDLITYLIKPASNVMMIHLDPKFSFFLSYFLSCSLSFFYFWAHFKLACPHKTYESQPLSFWAFKAVFLSQYSDSTTSGLASLEDT